MEKIKFLTVGDDKDDVWFLGYRLKLTPSEYKLLSALSRERHATAERLAAELGLSCDKKGNVAVHICSINRKAELIGERKLILFEDSEYRFNDNM